MEKICGDIVLVGNLKGGEMITQVDEYGRQRFVGAVKVATMIDALQVAQTTLTNVRCQGVLYNDLEKGRSVCLYLYRHLFLWPVLLGYRYQDDGQKFLITREYHRGTILQFAIVYPMLYGIAGLILGSILGAILGMATSAFLPVTGLLGGIGLAWYSAWRFHTDLGEAKADG